MDVLATLREENIPSPNFSKLPMGVPNLIDPTWCLLNLGKTMQKAASHHLIHQHSKQNQTRARMIGAEMFVSRCARGKSVAANGSLCLWKLLHILSRWNTHGLCYKELIWPIPVWTMNDSMQQVSRSIEDPICKRPISESNPLDPFFYLV